MPIATTLIACAYILCDEFEVVEAAANLEYVGTTKEGERPRTGSRKVDTWSMCFQGGTFDRVKERLASLPLIAVSVCRASSHTRSLLMALHHCIAPCPIVH